MWIHAEDYPLGMFQATQQTFDQRKLISPEVQDHTRNPHL